MVYTRQKLLASRRARLCHRLYATCIDAESVYEGGGRLVLNSGRLVFNVSPIPSRLVLILNFAAAEGISRARARDKDPLAEIEMAPCAALCPSSLSPPRAVPDAGARQ